MDIIEWLQHGGFLILGLSAFVSALLVIASGGGKFGTWVRAKMVGSIENEMSKFMNEHATCKPDTQRKLRELEYKDQDLEKEIEHIYKILEKDNQDRKLIFKILDAHSEHIIHDNHIDQVKAYKDELHTYVLSR